MSRMPFPRLLGLSCLGPALCLVLLAPAAAQGTLTTPASRAWSVSQYLTNLESGNNSPTAPEEPEDPTDPGNASDAQEPAANTAALREALGIGGADAYRNGGEVSAPIASPGDAPLTDTTPDDGIDPNANRPALTTAPYRAAIGDGRIGSAANRNTAGYNYFGLDRRDNLHRWPSTAAQAGSLSLTWTAVEALSDSFVYRVFLTREFWPSGGEVAWGDLEPLAEILPAAATRSGNTETFSITLPERRSRALLVVIRQTFDGGDNRASVAVADLDFRDEESATRGVDARSGSDQRQGGDNRGGAGPDGTTEDPDGTDPDPDDPNNPGTPGDPDDPDDPDEEFSFSVTRDDGDAYNGVLSVPNNTSSSLVDPEIQFVITDGEVSTVSGGNLEPGRGGTYQTTVVGTFAPDDDITLSLSVSGVTEADTRGPSQASVVGRLGN